MEGSEYQERYQILLQESGDMNISEDLLTGSESVFRVNEMLQECGFTEKISALSDCTISMFIIIFEKLFVV
jgi:hypothetical protein